MPIFKKLHDQEIEKNLQKKEVQWESVENQLESYLDIAKNYKGSSACSDLELEQHELHYFTLKNARLVEPRRALNIERVYMAVRQ